MFWSAAPINGGMAQFANPGNGAWSQTLMYGHQVAPGTRPVSVSVGGQPQVFYVDAANGNTISRWFWDSTNGWQQQAFWGPAVTAGTSPTVVEYNGHAMVFFADASRGNTISKWEYNSTQGYWVQPLWGAAVAPNTSPSAVMVGGKPQIFFSDADHAKTISRWFWDSTNGWQQQQFWGPAVTAGSTPTAVSFNGHATVFFADASRGNTISKWEYNSTQGYWLQPFWGGSLAPNSSPSAYIDNSGFPRIAYVDANRNNALTMWFWTSQNGWIQAQFATHPITANTSPAAQNANGREAVYFSDATNGNTLAEWSWNSTQGWNQRDLWGGSVAAGTSPTAVWLPNTIDTPSEADQAIAVIRSVSDSEIAGLLAPLTQTERDYLDARMRSAFAEGTLWRDATPGQGQYGRVWWIHNGRKHWIPNPQVASDVGLNPASAPKVTNSAIAGFTSQGPDLQSPTKFMAGGAACSSASPANGNFVGIALPQPYALTAVRQEKAAFDSLVTCLKAVNGGGIQLRTQIPIDVFESTANSKPGRAWSWRQNLDAFADTVKDLNVDAVISIRAHSFVVCDGLGGRPSGSSPVAVAEGSQLADCAYPTTASYGPAFHRIYTYLRDDKGLTMSKVRWTAWNEPEHKQSALVWMNGAAAQSDADAVTKAGAYYRQMVAITGASQAIAGDFADTRPESSSASYHSLETTRLTNRVTWFLAGLNPGTPGNPTLAKPTNWAVHPYRDVTDSVNGSDTTGAKLHGVLVGKGIKAPAIWQTEIGSLVNASGVQTGAAAQANGGAKLRAWLSSSPAGGVRAFHYEVAAPNTTNDDSFDTGATDAAARARPLVCGLGGYLSTWNSTCLGTSTGHPGNAGDWVTPLGLTIANGG